MVEKTLREIDVLIRARYPILYLLTHEEGRIESLLFRLAQEQKKKLFTWTATRGLTEYTDPMPPPIPGKKVEFCDPAEVLQQIEMRDTAALFILKDFHPFLNDPQIVRRLRDAANDLKGSYKNILIVSPHLNLPVELEKEITLVDIPLPASEELMDLLRSVASAVRAKNPEAVKLTNLDAAAMVRAAQGLTLTEAENAFSKSVVDDGVFDGKDVSRILNEKQQIIRKSQILEFYPADGKLADIGGLENLKQWLEMRGKAFSTKAADFGLPSPKGALLLGAPGCGKSLTAKAVASAWQMPLLRLDLGRIFSGLVGSSEENMRRALKVAESVEPAVLWIDEIEKGLAGNTSGQGDSGTAARVFGTFLTWMQEKTAKVFVVATANRIDAIPPELLRRGRFDEIFFLDLPDPETREEILSIHIKKRKRVPGEFNLAPIAKAAEGFSGAELEHVVVEGLFRAYHESRELKAEDLIRAIQDTIPLSVTYAEQLRTIREWASTRARPADKSAQATVAATGGRLTRLEVAHGKKAV